MVHSCIKILLCCSFSFLSTPTIQRNPEEMKPGFDDDDRNLLLSAEHGWRTLSPSSNTAAAAAAAAAAAHASAIVRAASPNANTNGGGGGCATVKSRDHDNDDHDESDRHHPSDGTALLVDDGHRDVETVNDLISEDDQILMSARPILSEEDFLIRCVCCVCVCVCVCDNTQTLSLSVCLSLSLTPSHKHTLSLSPSLSLKADAHVV